MILTASINNIIQGWRLPFQRSCTEPFLPESCIARRSFWTRGTLWSTFSLHEHGHFCSLLDDTIQDPVVYFYKENTTEIIASNIHIMNKLSDSIVLKYGQQLTLLAVHKIPKHWEHKRFTSFPWQHSYGRISDDPARETTGSEKPKSQVTSLSEEFSIVWNGSYLPWLRSEDLFHYP